MTIENILKVQVPGTIGVYLSGAKNTHPGDSFTPGIRTGKRQLMDTIKPGKAAKSIEYRLYHQQVRNPQFSPKA